MAIIYANCLTQFCSSVVVATAYVVVVVAWGVWAVAACKLLLLAKKKEEKSNKFSTQLTILAVPDRATLADWHTQVHMKTNKRSFQSNV